MNDYLELHSLYHHGIKGQKWGVRKDKQTPASINKRNAAKRIQKESKKQNTNKKQLTAKGATKAAIALVGIGALTVGAIKVVNTSRAVDSMLLDIAALVEVG